MSVNCKLEIEIYCSQCGREINKYSDGLLALGVASEESYVLAMNFFSYEEYIQEIKKEFFNQTVLDEKSSDQIILHANFTCIRDFLGSHALKVHDWIKIRKDVYAKTEEAKLNNVAKEFDKEFIESAKIESAKESQQAEFGGDGLSDYPF